MNEANRYLKKIYPVTIFVLLLVLVFSVAVCSSQADPENWSIADWGSFTISVMLGLYFFLLSNFIGRSAQKRAEAVANAELITSIGLLAMNSARSLSGSEASALRVATDARAALQHYPSATVAKEHNTRAFANEEGKNRTVRQSLVESVSDAYIDLAFSTFLHSGSLARSVWTRLCKGTAAVVGEANSLAFGRRGQRIDPALASLADHVEFVELLGRALRKDAEQDLDLAVTRCLTAVWDRTNLPYPPGPRGTRSEEDEVIYRLDRFAELYKYELTVLHNWDILRENAARLCCEVELADIKATGDWLAPWYVREDAEGRSRPVSVLGGDLNERAHLDNLEIDDSTSHWPNPVLHGNLPQGMRTARIDNLCKMLKTQSSPLICVLAYELRVNYANGKIKRVILDGNHRLAAARRLSLDATYWSGRSAPPRQFKVVTFLIRERQAVDELTPRVEDQDIEQWRGFTPDIGLIRGSWRPSERRD